MPRINAPTIMIHNQILGVITKSTKPLSIDQITDALANEFGVILSVRHVTRKVNELEENERIEVVGKLGKTKLYAIPGQQLEPFESTSNPPVGAVMIRVANYNYSPDRLAKAMIDTSWSLLNDTTNREIANQLTTLILGNAAYSTLKAHSVLPVAHIRQPLEATNAKLKLLSDLIDTILSNSMIKDGSSGNAISNQTRDDLMARLESWITDISINVRSSTNGS